MKLERNVVSKYRPLTAISLSGSLWLCLGALSTLNVAAQSITFQHGPAQKLKEFRENMQVDTDLDGFLSGLINLDYPIQHDIEKKKTYFFSSGQDEKYSLSVFTDFDTFSGTTRFIATEAAAGQKVHLYDIISLNGKRYVFYSVSDKKGMATSLYASELNADLAMQGTPSKLFTTTTKNKEVSELLLKVSPNGKWIGVLQNVSVKDITQHQVITIINESLSITDTVHVGPKQIAAEYLLRDWVIDDGGNVYQVGWGNLAPGKEGRILCSYFKRSSALKVTPIMTNIKESFKAELKIRKNMKGPVVVGLFESDKHLGYAFYQVNASEESVLEGASDVFDKKDFEALAANVPWSVDNFLALPSGDFVFSLESNTQENYSDKAPTFHSGPAIILSVTPDGKEKWRRVLHKAQNGGALFISRGHLMLPWGNDVVVLYNDNPENIIAPPDLEGVKNYNGVKTSLVMQRISPEGKATKKQVNLPEEVGDYVLTCGANQVIEGMVTDNVYQVYLMKLSGMTFLIRMAVMEIASQ